MNPNIRKITRTTHVNKEEISIQRKHQGNYFEKILYLSTIVQKIEKKILFQSLLKLYHKKFESKSKDSKLKILALILNFKKQLRLEDGFNHIKLRYKDRRHITNFARKVFNTVRRLRILMVDSAFQNLKYSDSAKRRSISVNEQQKRESVEISHSRISEQSLRSPLLSVSASQSSAKYMRKGRDAPKQQPKQVLPQQIAIIKQQNEDLKLMQLSEEAKESLMKLQRFDRYIFPLESDKILKDPIANQMKRLQKLKNSQKHMRKQYYDNQLTITCLFNHIKLVYEINRQLIELQGKRGIGGKPKLPQTSQPVVESASNDKPIKNVAQESSSFSKEELTAYNIILTTMKNKKYRQAKMEIQNFIKKSTKEQFIKIYREVTTIIQEYEFVEENCKSKENDRVEISNYLSLIDKYLRAGRIDQLQKLKNKIKGVEKLSYFSVFIETITSYYSELIEFRKKQSSKLPPRSAEKQKHNQKALEDELELLKKQNIEMKFANANLLKQKNLIDASLSKLKNFEEENNKLKEEIKKAERQKSSNAKLQASKQTLTKQIERIKEEYKIKIQTFEKSAKQKYEIEVNKLKQENKNLALQHEKRIQQIKKPIAPLKNTQEDLQKEKRLKQLERNEKQYTIKIEKLQKQVSQLQQNKNIRTELQIKLEKSQRQLKAAQQQNKTIIVENERKIQQLKKSPAKYQNEQTQKQKIIKQFEVKSKEHILKAQKLQKEILTLQQQNKVLKTQNQNKIQKMQKQLKVLQQQNKNLVLQNQRKTKQIKESASEYTQKDAASQERIQKILKQYQDQITIFDIITKCKSKKESYSNQLMEYRKSYPKSKIIKYIELVISEEEKLGQLQNKLKNSTTVLYEQQKWWKRKGTVLLNDNSQISLYLNQIFEKVALLQTQKDEMIRDKLNVLNDNSILKNQVQELKKNKDINSVNDKKLKEMSLQIEDLKRKNTKIQNQMNVKVDESIKQIQKMRTIQENAVKTSRDLQTKQKQMETQRIQRANQLKLALNIKKQLSDEQKLLELFISKQIDQKAINQFAKSYPKNKIHIIFDRIKKSENNTESASVRLQEQVNDLEDKLRNFIAIFRRGDRWWEQKGLFFNQKNTQNRQIYSILNEILKSFAMSKTDVEQYRLRITEIEEAKSIIKSTTNEGKQIQQQIIGIQTSLKQFGRVFMKPKDQIWQKEDYLSGLLEQELKKKKIVHLQSVNTAYLTAIRSISTAVVDRFQGFKHNFNQSLEDMNSQLQTMKSSQEISYRQTQDYQIKIRDLEKELSQKDNQIRQSVAQIKQLLEEQRIIESYFSKNLDSKILLQFKRNNPKSKFIVFIQKSKQVEQSFENTALRAQQRLSDIFQKLKTFVAAMNKDDRWWQQRKLVLNERYQQDYETFSLINEVLRNLISSKSEFQQIRGKLGDLQSRNELLAKSNEQSKQVFQEITAVPLALKQFSKTLIKPRDQLWEKQNYVKNLIEQELRSKKVRHLDPVNSAYIGIIQSIINISLIRQENLSIELNSKIQDHLREKQKFKSMYQKSVSSLKEVQIRMNQMESENIQLSSRCQHLQRQKSFYLAKEQQILSEADRYKQTLSKNNKQEKTINQKFFQLQLQCKNFEEQCDYYQKLYEKIRLQRDNLDTLFHQKVQEHQNVKNNENILEKTKSENEQIIKTLKTNYQSAETEIKKIQIQVNRLIVQRDKMISERQYLQNGWKQQIAAKQRQIKELSLINDQKQKGIFELTRQVQQVKNAVRLQGYDRAAQKRNLLKTIQNLQVDLKQLRERMNEDSMDYRRKLENYSRQNEQIRKENQKQKILYRQKILEYSEFIESTTKSFIPASDSQKNDLRRQIERLNDELSQLIKLHQNQKRELRNHIQKISNDFQVQIVTANEEKRILRQDIERVRSEQYQISYQKIKKQREDIQSLRQESDRLTSIIDSNEETFNQMLEENKSLYQKLIESENSQQDLRRLIEKRQAQIESLTLRLGPVERKLKQFQERIGGVIVEGVRDEQAWKDQYLRKISQLQQKLKSLHSQKSTLVVNLSQYTHQLSSFKKDDERASSELGRLRQQKQAIQSDFARLKQQKIVFEQQINRLRADNANIRQNDLSRLRRQLEDAQYQLSKLKQAEFEKNFQNNRLKEQNTDFKNQLAKIRDQKQILEQNLTSSKLNYENISKQLTQFKGINQSAAQSNQSKRIADLASQLDSKSQLILDLQSKLRFYEHLQGSLRDKDNEIRRLIDSQRLMVSKYEAQMATNLQLSKETFELQSKLKQKQIGKSYIETSHRKQLDLLGEKLQYLQEQLQKSEANVDYWKNQQSYVKKQSSDFNDHIRNLELQLSANSSEISSLRSQLDQSSKDRDKQSQVLQEMQRAIIQSREWELKYTSSQRDVTRLQAEITQLQNTLKGVEKEKDRISNEYHLYISQRQKTMLPLPSIDHSFEKTRFANLQDELLRVKSALSLKEEEAHRLKLSEMNLNSEIKLLNERSSLLNNRAYDQINRQLQRSRYENESLRKQLRNHEDLRQRERLEVETQLQKLRWKLKDAQMRLGKEEVLHNSVERQLRECQSQIFKFRQHNNQLVRQLDFKSNQMLKLRGSQLKERMDRQNWNSKYTLETERVRQQNRNLRKIVLMLDEEYEFQGDDDEAEIDILRKISREVEQLVQKNRILETKCLQYEQRIVEVEQDADFFFRIDELIGSIIEFLHQSQMMQHQGQKSVYRIKFNAQSSRQNRQKLFMDLENFFKDLFDEVWTNGGNKYEVVLQDVKYLLREYIEGGDREVLALLSNTLQI